jgi:death-on-curing protein
MKRAAKRKVSEATAEAEVMPQPEIRLPSKKIILQVHSVAIATFGGVNGIRNDDGLESALARPQNMLAYSGGEVTVFQAAAAIASGISRNHPFFDGNKRAAFLAAYSVLWINGYFLDAAERQVVEKVRGLADRSVPEDDFCGWLEENSISREAAGL